jgi:hypothetical protein
MNVMAKSRQEATANLTPPDLPLTPRERNGRRPGVPLVHASESPVKSRRQFSVDPSIEEAVGVTVDDLTALYILDSVKDLATEVQGTSRMA